MDKLISLQAAIKAVEFGITYAKAIDTKTGEVRELFKQSNEELRKAVERIKALPSIHPDTTNHDSIPAKTGKNGGDGTSSDCISRQQAIDKFIDGLEEIFADLRERHVDDSVCGLCEYDGAYMGQSGDWCNECPGFDRDDCFKLSDKTRKKWTDEIIKALPSAQPERKTGQWIPDNTDYYRTKFICSACGKSEEVPTTGFGYGTMWDYCPMCGAKMEAGE